ncbi:hypothetical protein WJX73_002061 [Symbiochloris irregularis]|uniref:MPN domain-containing protein n=1 Tax=Symbiochloris irregularis TaxID=706552 RepID=A0AAW1NLX2_9CHLO
MGTSAAQSRWELENNIQPSAAVDNLYVHDAAGQQALLQQKPWTKDPQFFNSVQVSALALLKMAMHAKSGGNLEIMGMLQGRIQDNSFIVMDAYALPVEGTETRVNAQQEAYEFIVDFADTSQQAGRKENVVGWYHSHPGYGCWLSGIDVGTQMTQQLYQDPFLAIVVDPHRTIAAGKVEIGAFRTYPEGYKPPDEPASEYQTIPLNKIEDFGVHCKQYYPLNISFFKSSLDAHLLDLLWNKYWVNTLSTSPLVTTRDLTSKQYVDIGEKLDAAEHQVVGSGRSARFSMGMDRGRGSGSEQQLTKVARDASKLTLEQVKGVSMQVIKDVLFNHQPSLQAPAPQPAAAVAAGPTTMET